MLVRTQEELQKQTEVKSSTASPDSQETKAVYVADVAYQKYVLEKCGITVVKTHIVNISSAYVYDGNLDLQQLFTVMDISKAVEEELQQVAGNLSRAEQILSSKEEPEKELHSNCRDPYACPYWNYCARNLPEKSVFDLYRLPFKKKL